MRSVRLVLERESISHRMRKEEIIIYGNIYLQMGDHFFPEKGWSDFAYRVLKTWHYHLTHCSKGELFFMDGPYSVGYAINEDKIILNIEEYGQYECLFKEFYDDLIFGLNEIKHYMKNNNIEDAGYD